MQAPPLKLLRHRLRDGFTLIEMSIVLVIIGLVVGGIVSGVTMAQNAKMNKQMSEIENLSSVVNAFKNKYNCLPGDCPAAGQFFTASAQPEQVTNGNGNGKIDRGNSGNGYAFSWIWGALEWKYVFDHLAASQLLTFNQYDESNSSNNRAGYGYPRCIIDGDGRWGGSAPTIDGPQDCGLIMSFEFIGHFFRLGASPGETSYNNTTFWAGYSPATALLIDNKFDDGLPLSGTIQAAAIAYQAGWSGIPAGWPDAADLSTASTYGVAFVNYPCTNSGYSAYNTASIYRFCSLRIKAKF